MTCGTNLNFNVLFNRTSLECVTTSASRCNGVVCRMNTLFHLVHLFLPWISDGPELYAHKKILTDGCFNCNGKDTGLFFKKYRCFSVYLLVDELLVVVFATGFLTVADVVLFTGAASVFLRLSIVAPSEAMSSDIRNCSLFSEFFIFLRN